jgi:hypothetical protein
MADLIVKVNPARAADPAAHVARVLKDAGALPPARVEEVFPGLRTGHSAGLVSVAVPDTWASADRASAIAALEHDDAIEYAQASKPRRPKRG